MVVIMIIDQLINKINIIIIIVIIIITVNINIIMIIVITREGWGFVW